MVNAILAAEDERFYSHGGVDYLSVLRAAASNVASGTQQGAGTITMQVARNFFLTREKTITRKLREVLLAWKIEANLSKDEILQLYVNQIFLGQRAYGFAAAAQIYFGKALKDLTPAEAAMLAGLPKAPSTFNPVSNPKRAKTRQLYVLRRMHDLKYISSKTTGRRRRRRSPSVRASRDAAHARRVRGRDGAAGGVRRLWRRCVHQRPDGQTTIRKADQEAAYQAVRRGVIDYDHRHGYRGPEAYVRLPEDAAERDTVLEQTFADTNDGDGFIAAVVTEASATVVKAILPDGEVGEITGDGLKFVARSLGDKAAAATRIRTGAVIRLMRDAKGKWEITQLPQAESAFVSIRPQDGAIFALVGGWSFERNKFNHVTQAQRQPGSRSSRSSTRRRSRRASRRRRSSTMRRSSCPARRAARTGSPRTTTASSTARCASAPRSPARRTS
jgi:penicillin-binding protein 1A